MVRRLALLSLVVLLSGCASFGDDPQPEPPAEPEPTPEAPQPLDLTFPFAFDGASAGGAFLTAGEMPEHAFRVPENTTLLEATADWACASGPACSLTLRLNGDAHMVSGPSPLRLEVPEPRPGTWTVSLTVTEDASAAAQANGTLAVATRL